MYALARSLLFCLDAERAHDLSLKAIETAYRTGLNPLVASKPRTLPTRAFGIDFANPVGLAAGLDKNAAHVDALASLGFGFIEVGTTTPRAQPGNPKPRMFRLPEYEAVINRLGFNNGGVDALVANAERARYDGVLGINIGKNKDTPNERALDDYLFCLERVYARASYVTVNISSPNTQGLRDLQEEVLGGQAAYVAGELRPPLETAAGVKFGTLICYDNAFPGPSREQVASGARLLVVISNETWFAGGGFKGGTQYGSSDEFGYKSVENRVNVHDIHATVLHLLGLNHLNLTYLHNGRSERATVNGGKLIEEALA